MLGNCLPFETPKQIHPVYEHNALMEPDFRPAERLANAVGCRDKVTVDQRHVQAAWMTVPWWRPQSYYDEPGRGVLARDGGGVLMTQAIHTLDLFRWRSTRSTCSAGSLA